ncbi:MAG: JAB domain-containing protein [Proteobacteria bacterium]|nr:JAB domain-containing protein [Pseudomonadota bacterium]
MDKHFAVGCIYYTRSICDHNCIYQYEVIKRTEKTLWIRDPRYPNEKRQSRRIQIRDGVEGIYPSGRYSMAPYLSADKIYDPTTVKPDWEKDDFQTKDVHHDVDIVKVGLVKDTTLSYAGSPKVCNPEDAGEIIKQTILKRGQNDREQIVVIMLANDNRVIATTIAHMGSLDRCIVHPREIMKTALLANARSIILGHNHPSSTVNPSPDDLEITRRIALAASVLEVKLLDHVIVSFETDRIYSMEENGVLPRVNSRDMNRLMAGNKP